MKIVAEKRILEMSEENIVTEKTMYEVQPGETVEALLERVGITGSSHWHYSQAELGIKLVVPAERRENP